MFVFGWPYNSIRELDETTAKAALRICEEEAVSVCIKPLCLFLAEQTVYSCTAMLSGTAKQCKPSRNIADL
jgi:hypothetical protein